MPTIPVDLRKILVPVDFSAPAEMALQSALAFAARFGGSVTLLHVIDTGRVVGELNEFGIGLTEIPRRAQERLALLASRSGDPALFGTVEVRNGRPSRKIAEVSRELGMNLIVISTHGYTGLDYVLLGGTAERVLREARCPVLVVRRGDPRPPAPTKILVPVDFSAASLEGLRFGLSLAHAFDAKVTVLHVVEPPGPMARLESDVHTYERKLRGGAKLHLDELHLEVGQPRDGFETAAATGAAYHEIVETARRDAFDLIVMASIGRSGLPDLLLGSVAERVVRHAPCSVLVVRAART
jgi:nucleotide-binding universal stress UspA family protein